MNAYIDKLKKLTLDEFRSENVKIVLFGSRARREHRVTSDVDIGLLPSGKLNKKRIVSLEEKIEELNIPYKVEIVDLSETSEDFKREAMKGAVVWKGWN